MDPIENLLLSDPAAVKQMEGTPAGPAVTAAAAAWNTRKSREEYDMYKSRLQDQRFSVADYPDPLSPRPPHPKQYPKGTDPKLEQMLHELIAKVKRG